MYMTTLLLHLVYVSSIESSKPTVIIVGAGAAGIAAATKISEMGVANVTVLEAQGRIGGRINSVEFGDGVVDLGAEWIRKFEGNTVYDMVVGSDLLQKIDLGRMRLYYSNKAEIDLDLTDDILTILQSIYGCYKKATEGVSIGEYYSKEFVENRHRLPKLTDSKKRNFISDLEDYLRHLTLCLEGARTWDEPAARTDYNAKGVEYFRLKEKGFKFVLDTMMKKHPGMTSEQILCNKVVTKIIWDNKTDKSGLTTVKCSDGSIYRADYIVFTPSLGVMKEQHVNLFEPRLPQAKVNAIEKLGTGPVSKIFFLFEREWWPSNISGFNFVWTQDDKETLKRNEKHWLLGLVALLPIEGTPKVLTGWFSGEHIDDLEKLGNVKIKHGIMFALKKFFKGKYKISHPVSVLQSSWLSNVHFRGVSMYETVASRKDRMRGINHIHEMGRPLYNNDCKLTVLFAGDAYHPTQYGTVDGAILSGYSVADKITILAELNKYS